MIGLTPYYGVNQYNFLVSFLFFLNFLQYALYHLSNDKEDLTYPRTIEYIMLVLSKVYCIKPHRLCLVSIVLKFKEILN